MEKEQRYEKKIEHKEIQRSLKIYKKEYHRWYKQQAPEVQKRLKKQKRETNKFYKQYGKANVFPEQNYPFRTKYHRDGIK